MRWLHVLALTTASLLATPLSAADESAAATDRAAVIADADTAADAEGPPLDGHVIERTTGGFIQVTMKDHRFVMRFFDEKRRPVAPDVDRAVMRLLPAGRDPERFVLSKLHDEMSLTHGPPVRAPHVFKVFLGLYRGTQNEAVESYSTSFP